MTRTNYKYSYEENKKIAAIRHRNTDYDRYDIFYNVVLSGRKKLNFQCAQLLSNAISVSEFTNSEQQILDEVNLNKKANQKRLLTKYTIDLQHVHPNASNRSIKNTAKKLVKDLILFQERRNLRRAHRARLYFSED
ncbi:MAG: hypothetical protein J5613_01420 [Alphaproteobacteria bacterium]|nr:hypothetical protein [Alphaproteobacteria bacterium]